VLQLKLRNLRIIWIICCRLILLFCVDYCVLFLLIMCRLRQYLADEKSGRKTEITLHVFFYPESCFLLFLKRALNFNISSCDVGMHLTNRSALLE